MSFQWIIDNAESISIDRQQVTGQTVTRNNTVRTSSRGGSIWKFTVSLPAGLKWTDIRSNISLAEQLGRVTAASISISATGHNYLVKYLGNSANTTGFTTTLSGSTATNTFTLTASPSTPSGYKFRAGDIIQFGSGGRVYTVAADVAYNSNSVTVNRLIDDANGSYTLRVGPNVSWNVICVQFPSWTIVDYDRVQWSGPFVFYENRV